MPTYEYACDSCERRFDVFQRFEEEPLAVCEVCGGNLRRVFHPVGVLFKGSGFYSTDSKARSKAGAASSKAGEESGSKESGDASSSEKPGTGSGAEKKADSGKSGNSGNGGSKAKSKTEGS